jgi:hypothetical protein
LFLIAGSETTSVLLTFACYELALNQDIQEKLRKEIKDVLGKYGGHCSYDALMEMTYLEMVLLGLFNILWSSLKLNMNPQTHKSQFLSLGSINMELIHPKYLGNLTLNSDCMRK